MIVMMVVVVMVVMTMIHAKDVGNHLSGPMLDSDGGFGGLLSQEVARQLVTQLLVG